MQNLRFDCRWPFPIWVWRFFPLAVSLFFSRSSPAADDFLFITNQYGSITITGYVGPGGNISIPTELNGISVRAIGPKAFFQNTNIVSLTIPSIRLIDEEAFSECANLTYIDVGDADYPYIYHAAFSSCPRLRSVQLPWNVVYIADAWVFYDCPRLARIDVGWPGLAYSSDWRGVLYDLQQKTLIRFPQGRSANYEIPFGVTNVQDAAFIGASRLTGISIPETVVKIGDYAFMNCSGLTNLLLPDSLQSIGYQAFSFTSLRSVVLGAGLFDVKGNSFSSCVWLESVYSRGSPFPLGWYGFDLPAKAIIYYLPCSTGWSNSFAGHPTKVWGPKILLGDNPTADSFAFGVLWRRGDRVAIEYCDDLTQGEWFAIATLQLDSESVGFRDAQWKTKPSRFYRVAALVNCEVLTSPSGHELHNP